MSFSPVVPGSTFTAEDDQPVGDELHRSRLTSTSFRSQCSKIRVEPLDKEYSSVEELQQEVDELLKVRITKGLKRFTNDDIEAEYVATVVNPTLRTRIIPVAVALFAYSLYSLEFSEWFDSTPYITQWRTAANALFNLSWIYHMLSSIAMFTLCIIPARTVCGLHFEVIAQIWLNIGIWVGVLFGNRWRSTKIFGYDPAAPFGEGLEQDSRPYPSDADLLLLLNGIVTYFCVWTPTRVRLLIPLAITVCLSYCGTSIIFGGPNNENPLSQSVMLILLVCMVISGKMSLEKNVRQEYVAFNISVRKTKLLEHTVRKLNNSEAGGGPTTNYEKAFADIGSALELLEGFSGGSVVQSAEFFDSVSRGFRSSDVVELHSLTRDTQYKEQIIGATTLIRESVKILSRRTSIDKVVFRDTPSTRREARRDFIEYMNHILNQNSTPNQLNKEWTLMTGGKVTLNATSSYMGDITAKAYGMLQTAGQDYNLNLIELQDSVLPNMPILQFIATQLASVLAFGALRIEWDILNNFLSRVSGTYTEVEYHNQMHAAQVTSHGEYLLRATGVPVNALDHTAFLVACICHDVGHSGKNNAFYVETGDRLALRYNDRSVLEQFHVATAFELMEDFPECNIIQDLTREESKRFRSLVIELILSTDMAKHFAIITDLRLLLRDPELRAAIDESKNADDRLLILKACIKAADIGHTCLPWDQHYELSLRLSEEFFKQGDLEKELNVPISPLCDREKVNLPQSQLGFIDYLVRPFIDILTRIDACHQTDIIKEQLENNARGWKAEEDLGKIGLPPGWSYRPPRPRLATESASKVMDTPGQGDGREESLGIDAD